MKSLTFTEIETIVSHLNSLALDTNLKSCSVALTKKGKLWGISGGQCRVYKVFTGGGQTKALRIWQNLMSEAEIRCDAISKYIQNNSSSYFLDFEFIPNAFKYKNEVYPAILMDWCPAPSLKSYIQHHLADKNSLKILQKNFLLLIQDMHNRGISHGDLHHDNIRVYDDGKIALIDYDSLYVPDLQGRADNCLGYAGYQLPGARALNKELSSKVDYFSELIIYLGIEVLIKNPTLWDELHVENQDQSFLFQPNEFKNITQSATYVRLFSLGGNICKLLKILSFYLSNKKIEDLIPFYDVDKTIGVFSVVDEISNFCINCGSEFSSREDLYCTKCGCKRI